MTSMRARLVYQAGHAIVWRDAIVQYFFKLSGIPDEKGRAGHYPGRFEAEDAKLTGYKVIDVTPWEDASGGKAVSCEQQVETSAQKSCSAEWTLLWGIRPLQHCGTQYFDLQGGAAKFTLEINGKQAAGPWSADASLPDSPGHTATTPRYTVANIELKPGDVIRIEGTPDAADLASLDYIEIEP